MGAMLYHLALPADWEAAQADGRYVTSTRGRTLAEEGFIHLSRADQVAATAGRFYADVDDLLLLVVDPTRLPDEVREESVGEDTFPHLYGPLPLDAVVGVRHYAPGPDGTFRTVLDPGPLTPAAFEVAVGERLLTDDGADGFALDAVRRLPEQPHAPRPDPFALDLSRPGPPVEQQLVGLSHPAVGRHDIFVVPVGHADGVTSYEAIFS